MRLHFSLWPVWIACVLMIACEGHGEERNAARRSLALAVSLEQAGIDTSDLSILQPAWDYYPRHGNLRERMLLWYHLGRVRFNREEYGDASVCFRMAMEAAAAADDPLYEGRSLHAMADVYNRTFNVRDDSLYLQRAYDAFRRAGDSLSMERIRLRLAGCYPRQNIPHPDSLWLNRASEAVSRAQLDYLEAEAARERREALREKKRCRRTGVCGLLLAAVLAVSAEVLFRRERARRSTVQQALSDSQRLVARLEEAEHAHLNKIHSLTRDVRVARTTLEEVRADYLFLFRDRYKQLGSLFTVRYTTGSDRAVCQRVGEILKDIDGDRKGFRQLRKYIEEKLDKPISRLLKDIPDLKEDDIRLFCYLVIGYEPSLISLLMGIDNLGTVYSRKHRLLERIRKLPASRARRYLELVS